MTAKLASKLVSDPVPAPAQPPQGGGAAAAVEQGAGGSAASSAADSSSSSGGGADATASNASSSSGSGAAGASTSRDAGAGASDSVDEVAVLLAQSSRLSVKVDLSFQLRLPPPLSLVPGALLSTTGGLVVKLVLQSLMPSFLQLLSVDYGRWASGTSTRTRQALPAGSLVPAASQQAQQEGLQLAEAQQPAAVLIAAPELDGAVAGVGKAAQTADK